MENTYRFSENSRQIKIFICTGKGSRESGNFSIVADNFQQACTMFAKKTNHVFGRIAYGEIWKSEGKKEGNPKDHEYFKDNLGNELLLIDIGTDRRFWS